MKRAGRSPEAQAGDARRTQNAGSGTPGGRAPSPPNRYPDAARLLEPRSTLGPLFGVTQRDIDSASMSLSHNVPQFPRTWLFLKRAFDISASLPLLALLSPVFIIAGIAIAISSKGPIYYISRRVGLGGEVFAMAKFRTMRISSDPKSATPPGHKNGKMPGPPFSARHDPRVTSVGRVLRRFSLDEIPQLFNVLGGSMSLVGPRPALPHEFAAYEGRMMRRFLVKPGITGLWQVSGRSDLSWEESMRLDTYYAENWTPSQDLAIVARTFWAVLSGRGAY